MYAKYVSLAYSSKTGNGGKQLVFMQIKQSSYSALISEFKGFS